MSSSSLPASLAQPTIACPSCGTAVRLTDALAAPLVDAMKRDYESRLQRQAEQAAAAQRAQEAGFAEQSRRLLVDTERLKAREATLAAADREGKARLEALRGELDTERSRMAADVSRQTEEQLRLRLGAERKSIAETEQRRAAERMADELAERDRQQRDKDQRITELHGKLAAARDNEAQLLERQRELDEREQALKLQVEQEVRGKLDQVRAVAATQAEERLGLQLADKDRALGDLRSTVEDLQRKLQQGSQQAQGETLEVLLEDQLRRKFPFDLIEPVAKGESGADILQIVRDDGGHECGRILWESKRTKAWSPGWLPKLRGDQRAAKADLAVLISQAMPPDVQHFNEVDGVWVSSLACTVPVAVALRASLLQLAGQRRASEGQQTKSEMVYSYLTGPHFRSRLDAISERWREMRKDLDDERRATMLRWKKREKQLDILLESTTGIMGDLHGITGSDLPEINALETMLLLE
ncbi:MAG: DUF2130 domain-containing protein [Janthinobacterium lividum]